MDRDQYYKYMFLTGAVWNIFVSVLFIPASILMPTLVSMLMGMVSPPSMVWVQLFFSMVLIFGVGYFIFKENK